MNETFDILLKRYKRLLDDVQPFLNSCPNVLDNYMSMYHQYCFVHDMSFEKEISPIEYAAIRKNIRELEKVYSFLCELLIAESFVEMRKATKELDDEWTTPADELEKEDFSWHDDYVDVK